MGASQLISTVEVPEGGGVGVGAGLVPLLTVELPPPPPKQPVKRRVAIEIVTSVRIGSINVVSQNQFRGLTKFI